MNAILLEVIKERARQDAKWGVQDHADLKWLGILMEEVGEVAKSIIENNKVDEYELIQVIAVVFAWLEISRPEVVEAWQIFQK